MTERLGNIKVRLAFGAEGNPYYQE